MRKPFFFLSLLVALLVVATPGSLHACGGSGEEGAGDFTGAGEEQAPAVDEEEGQDNGGLDIGGEGDVEDDGEENPNAPSPSPTTLPEDVQTAANQLEQQYNLDIRGEWSSAGLDQLAIVLSFYEDKPEYFNTFSHIEMEEVGTINATGGVGAFYNGGRRFIHVYGFSQQFPDYQSPAEVTQHEFGHHFSLTPALGQDWQGRYQNAVMSGPNVSRYGTNERPAEKMAEAWSKLLNRPGDPYFNPPTWNGANSETVSVIKERIDVALDPNNGG